MPFLTKQSKTKKLDLSSYFDEEAYLTIQFIPRDIWRYANRLILKTVDANAYPEVTKNKEYIELQKKIEKAEGVEKIDLQNKLNLKIAELLAQKYEKVSLNVLKESTEAENERNKLLIEYGVDKDNHNFYDENKNKITLTYDILKNTPFFDYLINEIIIFNSEFDLGEKITVG